MILRNTRASGGNHGYAYKQGATGTTIPATGVTAVQVYPNPTGGQLTVAIPADMHADRYSISNMLGQNLLQGTLAEGKNELTVSSLAAGSYVISMYSNGSTAGTHIFVKK